MEPVAHPTPYSMSLRRACWDVPAGASVPSRGGWEGGGSLGVSSRSPTTEPMGPESRRSTVHSPGAGSREGTRSSVVWGFLNGKLVWKESAFLKMYNAPECL